jgi:hypothetical protein
VSGGKRVGINGSLSETGVYHTILELDQSELSNLNDLITSLLYSDKVDSLKYLQFLISFS